MFLNQCHKFVIPVAVLRCVGIKVIDSRLVQSGCRQSSDGVWQSPAEFQRNTSPTESVGVPRSPTDPYGVWRNPSENNRSMMESGSEWKTPSRTTKGRRRTPDLKTPRGDLRSPADSLRSPRVIRRSSGFLESPGVKTCISGFLDRTFDVLQYLPTSTFTWRMQSSNKKQYQLAVKQSINQWNGTLKHNDNLLFTFWHQTQYIYSALQTSQSERSICTTWLFLTNKRARSPLLLYLWNYAHFIISIYTRVYIAYVSLCSCLLFKSW